MIALNITIYNINVLSSYVKPGDSGVVIVAFMATCNLSMDWSYKYSTWVSVPIQISDKGSASVQNAVLFFTHVSFTVDIIKNGQTCEDDVFESRMFGSSVLPYTMAGRDSPSGSSI
ncbi:hypothetical protein QYF36_008013 [Acer negundo]|nr:hypothetical protein QYF36_008013 [Acer negundo]